MAGVFAREWLFVGPAAWLSEPNDYVAFLLGDVPALAWMDARGVVRIFRNRCAASLLPLAGPERGSHPDLTCPCHGWGYAPDPRPGQRLPEPVGAAQSIGPFVFGRRGATPPSPRGLDTLAWCVGLIEAAVPGGAAFGDVCARFRIDCNWKLPAASFCGDLHALCTAAAYESLGLGIDPAETEGLQIATAAGALACGYRPAPPGGDADLTPIVGTIFPNLSFDARSGALYVWHPVSATCTEVHAYWLFDSAASDAQRVQSLRRWQALAGPFGMAIADAASVWADITRNAKAGAGRRASLSMGLGQERASNLPGAVGDLASEANQRAFYRWVQSGLQAVPQDRLNEMMTIA